MDTVFRSEQPLRILVVDDEPNELRALTIGLKLEGFHVVGVPGGKEAIAMLKRREFAVALIDLMMPQMNGIQLAREIRNVSPSTKTVLMSAYTLSSSQLNKIDIGVVGFVTKPFEFDELVTFLKHCIDSSYSEKSKSIKKTNVDQNGLHLPVALPLTG